MSKCLVTGGCGFIGSHIVDRLIELGHEVIVIDDLSAECNSKFYFNRNAVYRHFDITDYKKTRQFYDGCEFVFHLAAESRLQPAIENPINAMNKNVVGTCTVLQCSREAGINRVIYSSTSSGYGNNEIPNVETQSDDCLNPYSVSKIAGEKLCKMYTDLFGLNTITFRYFNVFGERCPEVGQYAPVLAIFERQNKNGEPLSIVGDGTQRRDFVHVSDIVEANILAMSELTRDSFGEIYNIASGKNTSIKELAESISSNIVFLPKRVGEVEHNLANIEKARRVLGFEPKINVLDLYSKKD